MVILKNININIFLIIIIAFYSILGLYSCSWVTRDYYYTPTKNIKNWKYTFEPQKQSNVKNPPKSDKAFVYYENKHIKIQIEVGHTVTYTFGPLWFPVFPYIQLPSHDKVLNINTTIYSKEHALDLDFSKLKFCLDSSNESHFVLYSKSKNKNVNIKKNTIKIQAYAYKTFILKSFNNPLSINQIKICFNGIKTQIKNVYIPCLNLQKRKGHFNYDEFTL